MPERVTVIGATGDEGFGLACRWAAAGIDVVIGSRDQGRAGEAAKRRLELVPDAPVGGLETALEGDVLACGSKQGKVAVRELVEAIPNLRYVDAGPLETARIIEPITALLIGLNHRYKIDRAGIHITGLPES